MHEANNPGKGAGRLPHRGRARSAAISAVLVLVLVPATVFAFNSIGNTWSGIYPASASRTNAGCLLCHGPNGTDTWNPYGWAISQGGANAAAISGAAGANSDGDPNGVTNLTEINANSQPGWTLGNNNTIYDINGNATTSQPVPAGITGLIDPATPTPTPTPVPTPTPTPVPTPTPTPVPTPTPTPVPTPVPTIPSVAGQAQGNGTVAAGQDEARFEFGVRSSRYGPTGHLQLRSDDLRFRSEAVTTFTRSGVTAAWTGTGSWNGLTGYSFKATAADNGRRASSEDKRHRRASWTADQIEITIRNSSGDLVFTIAGPVSRGDIVVTSRSSDGEHAREHNREGNWSRLRTYR